VLRVLGNAFNVPGFEYRSSEDVRDELKQALGDVAGNNAYRGTVAVGVEEHETALDIDVPIYSVDALVRRSLPLQRTTVALERAGESAGSERKRA
jgi:NADH-quinone oxidoreductase subunit G